MNKSDKKWKKVTQNEKGNKKYKKKVMQSEKKVEKSEKSNKLVKKVTRK